MKKGIKFLTALGLSLALLSSSASMAFAKTNMETKIIEPSAITLEKPMTKNINKVVLLSVNPDQNKVVNYQEILDVDPQYQFMALELAQLFQDAINPDTLYFDFNKAIGLVKQDKSLAITGTLNQTISKNSAQVSVVIDELARLLANLGVKLTPERLGSYAETITQAFTNLEERKDNAFIFWNKTTAHSTTYTYNIFFAIQNSKTGRLMAGLPVGLTITVDVEKKKVLGITTKDKHSYNVNVKAIQVVKKLV